MLHPSETLIENKNSRTIVHYGEKMNIFETLNVIDYGDLNLDPMDSVYACQKEGRSSNASIVGKPQYVPRND